MKSRYRVTAVAFLSLSAGTLWVNPTRADATAPFKVDPRLLGLPALTEPAPPASAKPTPPATPKAPEAVAAPTSPSDTKPLPAATPAKPPPLLPPSVPPAVVEKPVTPAPVPPTAPRVVEKPAPVAPTLAPTPAPTRAPTLAPTQAPAPISKPAEPTPPARVVEKPAPVAPVPAPIVRPAAPISEPPLAAISSEPPDLPPPDIHGIPLRLQPTLSLTPHPAQSDEKTPVFISAMQLQGKSETYVEAEDDVELRKRGLRVNADKLRYDETQETLDASGNVRIQTEAAVVKGPDLHYRIPDSTGHMNKSAFALAAGPSTVPGQGTAEKISFQGEDRLQLDDAKYSACAVGQEDWWIRANQLELDRSTNTGTGRNAWVEFKGVPLLYTPYITFPLRKERKSGFLAPALGTSDTRGFELSVPYYWNIAPNFDATITPRVLSKRGLQVSGEFRYLQPNYAGEIQAEVLPDDDITQTTRDAYRISHVHNFGAGFTGNVEFQKVSDDDYYRDLSPLIAATSQSILPREGNLNYSNGPFGANLKVQRYQVLQDPITPLAEPYERVPQLTALYRKLDVFGFADVNANAEYVEYRHNTSVNGSRFTFYPSFSVPLTRAYGYLTPKLGLHYTRYDLDQDQFQNPARLPDTTRTLPIFSVDSGLTFERASSLFGQSVTQTLEPRLYYLYVPFEDQNQIPLFDTGEPDFSFAQIFSENRFSGGDRISDANQVTLALTTRFIEADSGLERFRASVAQRYFFKTPRVTISPTTAAPTDKASDFLASVGGQVSQAWSAEAALQYNPNIGRNEKYNAGVRYNPEPGKVANLNYRYTRDALHQIDTSTQWPIAQKWQLLGRLNYSLQDSRILEALGGVEYREGCWAVRVVGHRFQTATLRDTNAIFLQLELSDLASLGTNPFNTLKQNIGGYTQIKTQPEIFNLDEF